MNEAILKMIDRDEKYCKVTETLLLIAFKFLKQHSELIDDSFVKTLFILKGKLSENPSILS